MIVKLKIALTKKLQKKIYFVKEIIILNLKKYLFQTII